MTLTDFLLARIAEDEEVARAASVGRWDHDGDGEIWRYGVGVMSAGWLVSHPPKIADAEHIARHDPARVLAECEAKRRLVKRYRRLVERAEKFPALTQDQAESREWLRQTVVDFVAVYADHPDYREDWKP